MNAHATVPYVEVEASLAAVLSRLEGHDDKALVIRYADRTAQAGYHITEVKAGSFTTLDCGANPDAWQETILQIEDIPAEDSRSMMSAGKFRSILAQVDRKVRLNHEARFTIEIGRPGEAMRVFDVAEVVVEQDRAVLSLGIRAAICKPRHRAQQRTASACCQPSGASSNCC